jgi:cytochrome P450
MVMIAQIEVGPEEAAARASRFPVGAAVEFEDLERADRADVFDRLRAAEPVSWVPAMGGWLVTSYEGARQVLSPRAGFTVQANENLVRASLGQMMLTTDEPGHEPMRAPFEAPFHRRAVQERFADPVRGRVDRLLDEIAPRGTCELGAEFAAPFAIGVAGDMLGLSLDDVPRIRGFYEAFAGGMVYDGDPEPQRRADAARAEFSALLLAELARMRDEPDRSLTSAVVHDPETTLSDDDIVAQLRVILFGAIETVESMVMNTIMLLLDHPEQLAAVRGDSELLPNTIEESLRLIPPVTFVERWSAAPATVGDVDLGPGEFVGVSIIGANRDPAVFEAPLRFDIRRKNARHGLSFSFGVHHCLGFSMARLQGATAVAEILRRLPQLEMTAVERPAGFVFRKPASLELRWQA